MTMWSGTFTTISSPPIQLPCITLPKVTTWLSGKTLLPFILCPTTVFVVMHALTLMKQHSTFACTGLISHCCQPVLTPSVLIHSLPTFGYFHGTKTYHATEPFYIKFSWPVCSLRFGQMDQPDSEMLAIWQNVLPKEELIKACKRPRSAEQTSPKRSRGRVVNRDPEVDPSSRELLQMLARLAIRHKDSIQVLLQQQQFILHLKSGPGSILPAMMLKTQEWHMEKERTISLRCCLAQLMMETLQERANKLIQASPKDEIFKASLKQNMVLEDGNFPFLSWNPQSKRLVVSKDKALSAEELTETLEACLQALQDPTNVLRFHALKKIPQDQELQASAVFPWVMTVTPDLYQHLQKLCFHSIWLLVAVDLKRQTASRSPLAKQVEQHLRGGR